MEGSKKGFTLIELLVVITIIGILAAIALPNYIKAKDKAKEVEAKANLHTIQIAVERYNTDHKEYPAFLLGGDVDGWLNWHRDWDNSPPPGDPKEPANAWVQDPLVEYDYITSYPENPFIDGGEGATIIDATSFIMDPQQGDGDPRFGYKGNIMGCGLDDPKFFEFGLHWASPRIETKRTLDRGQFDPTQLGYPSRNVGTDEFPGLYYSFGGRYNHLTGQVIFTFWPGNFFYQAMSDIQPARRGWTWPFPNRWYRGHVLRYMLGVWGSSRNPGKDLIRLQEVTPDAAHEEVWWRFPPPFPLPPTAPNVRCAYAISEYSGGLPAVFGGGNHKIGPHYPPDRDPASVGNFIYGAPDGVKDGVIHYLHTGQEKDEIED